MTPPKRTAKPRKVVTDATKAKLPKPNRTRKANYVRPADAPEPGEATLTTFPPRAIPCGEDVLVTGVSHSFGTPPSETMTFQFLLDPPAVTEPQPPVRVLNWLYAAPTKARRKLAAWLRALAGKVAPASDRLDATQERNEFSDVMADYTSFLDRDDVTFSEAERRWLINQEECVRAAVRAWVIALGGKP